MRDKKGAVKGKEESDRIRVFVRLRPKTEDELRRGEPLGVDVVQERNEITLNDGKERRFRFDGIFNGNATNRQVYNDVGRPLIDAAFSGFNGTLMAYGQTGTGKTFTLMSQDGVCILSVQKLFRRIQNDGFHDYKVFMSYLQIYQEKIYDLLNPNHKLEMVLREDPKKGVYVENLTEYVVRSAEEVMSLMRSGKKRLVFAETRMNRLSSSKDHRPLDSKGGRSHSVCQITIQRSLPRDGIRSARNPTKQFSKTSSCLSPPPRKASSFGYLAEGSKLPTMRSNSPSPTPGSLDHLADGSKIPQRKRSLPDGQKQLGAFNPRVTSTPNLRSGEGLRHPSTGKYSLSMTSLPEFPSVVKDKGGNRLSFPNMQMSDSFSGSVDVETVSEDSDLMESESESMDSLVCESTESNHQQREPGISELFEDQQDVFQEEEDDDEEFLQSIRIIDDVVTKGKINICDLAGSERVKRAQVEGERLSELQHINLSLLELGNTIHALSEGNRTHIPYRNSSLTRLLQDSLGGNCKTSFVMCISPTHIDMNETRCTLEFGQRALKIKNTAYVNMEVDFVKLAADLRRRLEIQELEGKVQKENFERQVLALKTDQEVKLAEKETRLELEKEQAKLQAEQLKAEKENLAKLLQEEKNQKALLEHAQSATMEKVLLDEKQNIGVLTELQQEIGKLKRELKDEKRRSLALEEQERENIEKLLKSERQRTTEVQLLERQRFENQLEEEKRKVVQQQEERERNCRDVYCQSPVTDELLQPEFPQIPTSIDHTSTETLYNVLLAEIMSLQLLYQMQDLADACSRVTLRARDSGWADYDEEVIENVGYNLLEKGGLLLNSLRGLQSGDTISMNSTESLREVFLFQFPSSPKVSRDFVKSDGLSELSLSNVSRNLMEDLERKDRSPSNASNSTIPSKGSSAFSSDLSNKASGLDSSSSSSMSSYCDQEPLSPRTRRQPSDSGCSSQHSESDMSPVDQRLNLQKEFSKRLNSSNVCVPLAEEDDEDLLDDVVGENDEHFQLLKEKVSTLEKDLVRLKSELDGETVNFFSAVFIVDLSSQSNQDSSHMRYLFDCVREKLLAEILTAQDADKETGSGTLELPLPVLEQAVNLLLVNKTVMSCILVLQNRTHEESVDEETVSEMGTLVQEITKVDQEVQTDGEVRTLRRRVRKGLFTRTLKNASVITDPEPKSPVHHKECQTSDEWTVSSLPITSSEEVNIPSFKDSSPNLDAWINRLGAEVTSGESFFSEDLPRDPDGASRTETPDLLSEDTVSLTARAEECARYEHVSSDEESEEENLKQKKKRKKISLLSCLGPRLSFRRKGSKRKTDKNMSQADTENLVK